MNDAYSILGISPSSTLEEARHAYRKLAQKNHPDKGGSEERFKDIKRAWEDIESGKATPPPQPQARSSFSESTWTSKPEPAWKGFSESRTSNAYRTAKPKIQPIGPRIVEAYRAPEPRTSIGDFIARVSLAEAYRGFICEVGYNGKKYRVSIPPGAPHGLRFSVQVEDKTDVTVITRINQNAYSFLGIDSAIFEGTIVNGEPAKVYRTKDLSIAYEVPAKSLGSSVGQTLEDFLGEKFTFKLSDADRNSVIRVKGRGYVDWYSSHSRAGTTRGDVLIHLVPTEKMEPTVMKMW